QSVSGTSAGRRWSEALQRPSRREAAGGDATRHSRLLSPRLTRAPLKTGIQLVSFSSFKLMPLNSQARVRSVQAGRPLLGALVALIVRADKVAVKLGEYLINTP